MNDYSIDDQGRKNGVLKTYDKNGELNYEIEILHDTLIGIAKFYLSAQRFYRMITFKKGLYKVTTFDSTIISQINRQSPIEQFFFNRNGHLSGYDYLYVNSEKSNLGISVYYRNDSIENIEGYPISPFIVSTSNDSIKRGELSVINIPKCQRNFYLLDSIGNVIDSCKGGKQIYVALDFTKFYALKVEYVDSIFSVVHCVVEPFVKWDKKKFPDGIQSKWTRI